MDAERSTIVVVAGVVERDGRLLVTRRLEGRICRDTGISEANASRRIPSNLLARELAEELNAAAEVGARF
jgi:hypothetical protein